MMSEATQASAHVLSLSELSARHGYREVSYSVGDGLLRYRLFSPFFVDIADAKVVYRDRYTFIARFEDVELTPEVIRATVVPLMCLESDRVSPLPWKIEGPWKWMRLLGRALDVPSGGWRVWPEVELTRRVEELMDNGDCEQALRILETS